MIGHRHPWFGAMMLGALLWAGQGGAAPPNDTSCVLDPEDDARGRPRDYMEVVAAEITAERTGGALVEFAMRIELAGPMPEPAPPPPSGSFTAWGWELDLDPKLFPTITPEEAAVFVPGPWEAIAYLSWDGLQFEGTLVDYRPTIVGEAPMFWEIPISVDGVEIRAIVDAALIGTSSFTWRAGAIDVYELPDGHNFVDKTEVVPWPGPCGEP